MALCCAFRNGWPTFAPNQQLVTPCHSKVGLAILSMPAVPGREQAPCNHCAVRHAVCHAVHPWVGARLGWCSLLDLVGVSQKGQLLLVVRSAPRQVSVWDVRAHGGGGGLVHRMPVSTGAGGGAGGLSALAWWPGGGGGGGRGAMLGAAGADRSVFMIDPRKCVPQSVCAAARVLGSGSMLLPLRSHKVTRVLLCVAGAGQSVGLGQQGGHCQQPLARELHVAPPTRTRCTKADLSTCV
jgi:hypothetical protein